MSEAVLGTEYIRFDADPSALETKIDNTEKLVARKAKAIESAVDAGITRSFRSAQGAITKAMAQIETGQVKPQAVIAVTQGMIAYRLEVERARGSVEKATAQEIQQFGQLEAQLKKVEAAAAAAAPRPVKAPSEGSAEFVGPTIPEHVDRAAMAHSWQQDSDITSALTKYEEVYDDLLKKERNGSGELQGEWKKLVALQVQSINAVKAKYGEISKATPKEIELLAQQEQKLRQVEGKIREITTAVRRRGVALGNETGMASDLAGLLTQIAGGYGAVGSKAVSAAVKGGLVVAILKEVFVLIGDIAGALNTSDTNDWWAENGRAAVKSGKDAKRGLADWAAANSAIINMVWPEIRANRMIEAGSAANGTGLFAPLINPKTDQGFDAGSEAFRLKLNAFDRFGDPNLDLFTRNQHQRDILTASIGDVKADRTLNADQRAAGVIELKKAIIDLDRATAALMNSTDQQIYQLSSEEAQMRGNKSQVATLAQEMDKLTDQQLKASGVGMTVRGAIIAQTKANRDLGRSIADMNERMETLGMMQSVAQTDNNFDAQRRLSMAYTEQAVDLAQLTGKSKEHIAALRDQGRQALTAIEIARLSRQQETVSIQQEVAQSHGSADAQRRLAAENIRLAISIAEKEGRTKEYIDALREQGVITQQQIDDAEMQRQTGLVESVLELANLNQQIVRTGQYGDQVAELTRQIEAMTVARLRASANIGDHSTADLLEAKFKLAHIVEMANSLREFNRLTADLDQQRVDLTLSTQERAVAAEKRADAERVESYRQMMASNALTAAQGDTLIAQSHALMVDRLQEIDDSYGRNWRRLIIKLSADYADHAMTVGNLMTSALGSVEGFLTQVLTPGAIRSFSDIGDAASDMLRSIGAEIARLMAQRAVMWLLGQFGGLGGGSASGSLNIGADGRIGTVAGMSSISSAASISSIPGTSIVSGGRGLSTESSRSINAEPAHAGGRPPIDNHVTVMLAHEFMGSIVSAAAQAATPSDQRIVMVVGRNILENGQLRAVIRNI